MTRYVVIGAGALGGTLSVLLEHASIAHVLVARGRTLEVVRRDGITLERPSGSISGRPSVVGRPDAIELTSDDVLVLATKTQHAEDVLQQWAWQPVDGGRTTAAEALPVVTFQNGLDTERVAARRFETVYGASIWLPGSHLEPGHVVNGGPDRVGTAWIGRFPGPSGDDPRLAQIVADLARLEIVTQLVDDVTRWKAAKLIGNLSNALDVLAPGTDGEHDRAVEALEGEARAVLAAAGLDVADYATEITVERPQAPVPVGDFTPGHKSTWQSVVRGADSVETDFLNGEVVLLGRLHGVKTPVNARLQALVSSSAHRGVGHHALADLLVP